MKYKSVKYTTVKISFLKVLCVSLFSGFRIRCNLIIGKLNLRSKSKWLYDFYQAKKKIMYQAELPEEIIKEWREYNYSLLTPTIERTITKTIITDEIINNHNNLTTKNSKQQRVAAFLNQLFIDKGNNIKTVANLGSRVDTISNYFSKKFKGINFHSIDMQSNLKEINLILGKRKNWKVHNDYALMLFKKKVVKPDMVIMISTSPKFSNKELYEYIKVFKYLGVKYLLFFEPWWAFPLSFNSLNLKKPEDLKDNYSPIGGQTADFHHNYISILNKNNYSPVICELRNVEGELNYHDLFIFAVDNKLIDD